jgi:hypothetical protein
MNIEQQIERRGYRIGIASQGTLGKDSKLLNTVRLYRSWMLMNQFSYSHRRHKLINDERHKFGNSKPKAYTKKVDKTLLLLVCPISFLAWKE